MAGIWGLYGVDVTGAPVAGQRRFPRYALGMDLRFPLCDWLAFQGECWMGSNLDDFGGGVAQGFDLFTGALVHANGGWAELVARPVPWYQMSLGFAVDNPRNSDIGPGGRTLNYAWYVGNRFPVGSGVTLGLDSINWTTEYNGFNKGNASLIKFFMQVAF
ncbi:MAG TPA: hypothetical protein VEL76_28975 [Gemmataceae bacterium]|nr:hypothetical protein [Gemmataceae bacterium]